MRKRKLYISLIITFTLLLVIAFTHTLWLEAIAKFLIINDELSQTEIIVVLDSGNGPVYNYGVNLYKSGYGKMIMLVGGFIDLPSINSTYSRLTMQWLVNSLKISEKDIILEERPLNIYESAIYVKEDLIKRNIKSAIIIGLPQHMRRAKMIFKEVFDKQEDISLIFISVNYEQFQTRKWWTRENEVISVISEYCRMTLYFFKYVV